MSIDGGPKSQADARGTLVLQVPPGTHTVVISLDGYQSFSQTLTLKNGDRPNIYAQLPAIPKPAAPTPAPVAQVEVLFSASTTTIQQGQSTTLSWQTANATQVSIDNGVGPVSASGQRDVSPANTTNYQLTATGAGGTQRARSPSP